MKVTRQKRHRRSVTFFRTCYGFRPPYKILCDVTFIHHLLVNRIIPADTAISNILFAVQKIISNILGGAPVKLFTTSCAIAEMKKLGARYSDSINAARKLAPARCGHEKLKSAVACLEDVIGESNSEHFFVATQHDELRKTFQEVPAVPVMFALRNALYLESPSQSQRRFAKAAEEERSRMNDLELQKKKKISSETDEQVDEVFPIETRKTTAVKDKVQFKRKRAKGPNPLSCKKKKTDKQKPVAKKEGNETNEAARSGSKKRKRSRKPKTVTSATD